MFFVLGISPVFAQDYNDLLPIIRACADIPDYDRDNTDINKLMIGVLYTFQNFETVVSTPSNADTSGSLHMCNGEFIREIMNKIFRLNAPEPSPEKLTQLGYYYSNGIYYYMGGYTAYFATNVNRITNAIPLDDGGVYVIFENTYTENNNEPATEHSAMRFAKDDIGYYVSSIDMGLDYSTLNEQLKTQSPTSPYLDTLNNALPFIIIVITVTVSVIILVKFILF